MGSFALFFLCLTIACYAYRLCSFVYRYVRPSSLKDHLTDNAYAIITGATNGIGKALTFELAVCGFNIILHGRDQFKLDEVKRQLHEIAPGRKVITLCQDGSTAPVPGISALNGLPVKVVVNNVGVGPVQPLLSLSTQEINETVALNVLFPTHLTHIMLKQEVPPSLIINISSYTGLLPPPFLSVYAGTKAYNNAFSKSLSVELEHTSVMSVLTGSVHTRSNTKPVSFFRPDAATFAKSILRMVGTKRKSVYPYWPHALQTAILSVLPAGFMDAKMREVMRREILR